MSESSELLVVGAGPTGIAIGAAAARSGLEPLLVDRRALAANLLDSSYLHVLFHHAGSARDRRGTEVDPATLVPVFDPASCESNVAGFYVAGTLLAGSDTGRIFIENSRAHAPLIVDYLRRRLGR